MIKWKKLRQPMLALERLRNSKITPLASWLRIEE